MNYVKKTLKENNRAQHKRAQSRFLNLQSMDGCDWAIFRVILGSRMTGKSYAVSEKICRYKKKYGDQCKVYWLRISDTSVKSLLCNKADKLIDPDLKRKYNLNLSTKGPTVYNNGKVFCEVYPLSGMGKLKGLGIYDKDFTGKIMIVLDEFQLEQGERRTSFNILYNFIGMLENIGRTTKSNIEVYLLGNTLEDASEILKAFNFLPEKFGRYYLKKKRCVIDNLEPTEEYLNDRYGSMADILGGDKMSNYTNELTKDLKTINKQRLIKPTTIIKFDKQKSHWYVLWDGKIIKRWNNQKLSDEQCINMKPYLPGFFSKERKQSILDMQDAGYLQFHSLIDQAYFIDDLKSIRKG